jgi:PAS domain S-box-containing protein
MFSDGSGFLQWPHRTAPPSLSNASRFFFPQSLHATRIPRSSKSRFAMAPLEACYDPSSVPSSRDAVDARSAVFDAALDAIVTIDHHGRIVEFNTAAEQIFGRARDAVRGQEIAETIIPERFREAHHRGLRRYLETGAARVLGKRIEVAALRANGEEFPVELAVVRVPNSDPPLFTAFLRDLTEQRRLEQRRSAVYNLAEALAEAESLDDAAQPLLRILATTFGASVGAF